MTSSLIINEPLVSVVVPIYKVERYLRQCVDSILAQTLQNIEVILIDDGSPDGCPVIVDEYAANDSRVVAVHQPNGGYGKAVNHGISLARGKYIGIVEPDDFIEPGMYELLYEKAEEYQTDVAKCWFYSYMDTESKQEITPAVTFLPGFDTCFTIMEQPELLRMHPSVWSAIYRREFLEENKIRVVEAPGAGWTDNPFQVQTLCCAKKIYYVDKPMYYWRQVNLEAADDLKDYRIPFLRSDEIHAWLKENNMYKPELLSQLYFREMAYVLIVSRMLYIDDMKDCCSRIKAMIKRMDKKILRLTPFTRKFRKAYRLCCLSPRFYIFTRRLRRKLRGV